MAESWDPVQHNVEFATVNATRWHSSVWKAYVFVYNNLSAIAEFYCQETECKSILGFLAMAKNKGTVKIILKELEEYIACFNTTAQYLNRISDHSSEAPVACHVASLEEQVVHGFKLLRTNEPAGSWKHNLATAMLKEWEEYPCFEISTGNTGAVPELINILDLLCPQRLHLHNSGYGSQVDGAAFLKAVKIRCEQLKHEWETYVVSEGETRCTPAQLQNPALWWRLLSVRTKYPKLSPLAQFLCVMPVVVTGCDGAISIEQHMYNARQTRMNRDRAGRNLATHINLNEEMRLINRSVGSGVRVSPAESSPGKKS